MTSAPREIESTLLVCADDPAAVVTALAMITHINGYALQPLKPQRLNDIYFDTRDGRLGSARVGLRLRSVDGTWYVTLKGPSHQSAGTADRGELELAWSKQAFEEIHHELSSYSIRLKDLEATCEASDPIWCMQRMGFVVVQNRDTERQRRAVVTSINTSPVAELAIDAVTFKLASDRVRLYAVEVELKDVAARSVLLSIVEALEDRYPSRLRRWSYGKLPTGKAIDVLIANGELRRHLSADRVLRPAACSRIEDFLKETAGTDSIEHGR